MKQLKRFLRLPLLLMSVLFLPIANFCPAETSPAFKISISKSQPDTPNLPLLPVPVLVTISNNTTSTLKIFRLSKGLFNTFNYTIYKVQYRERNKEWKNIIPYNYIPPLPLIKDSDNLPLTTTLEPDGNTTYLLILTADWSKYNQNMRSASVDPYFFAVPGVYELRIVREKYNTPFVISNVLNIEVLQPSGEEAKVYNYLKSIQFPGMLLFPDPRRPSSMPLKKVREHCNQIIKLAPNSLYASHARLGLGICAEDLDLAITLLEEANRDERVSFKAEILHALAEKYYAKERDLRKKLPRKFIIQGGRRVKNPNYYETPEYRAVAAKHLRYSQELRTTYPNFVSAYTF